MTYQWGTLPAPPAGLAPLSKLTALQHLHCMLPKEQCGARFPAGVLCRMKSLTHVALQGFALDKPALRGISLLSNLQQLQLGPASRWSPDGSGVLLITAEAVASVSGLQHLTSLGLAGVPGINSSILTGLSTRTALKELSLCDCGSFRPAGLLEVMTGLTHLYCRDVVVNTSELLRVLPRLQQLEYLGLREALYTTVAPAADFRALTASSKLKELELVGALLPAGALASMFSPRKQLAAVTRVVLNTFPGQTLGTQELQAIVRCCPSLRSLVARGCVVPGTDWGVLASLQHLRDLTASHVTDAEAAGLAHLVQLHSLSLVPPGSSISILGVQHLTALKKLTLFTAFSDDSPDSPMAECFYENKAPRGSPPDVWRQIQRDTYGGGLGLGMFGGLGFGGSAFGDASPYGSF